MSTTARLAGVAVAPAEELHAQLAQYAHAMLNGQQPVLPSRITSLFAIQDGPNSEAGSPEAQTEAFHWQRPGQGGFLSIPSAVPRSEAATAANQPPAADPPAKILQSKSDDIRSLLREYFDRLPQEVAQNWLKNSLQNLFLGGGLDSPFEGLGGIANGLINTVDGPAASASLTALGGVLRGVGGDGLPDLGQLTGSVLSGLTNQLLGSWQVEDSDSVGEQLAHHFANKYQDQALGAAQQLAGDPSSLASKLKTFFCGTTSGATLGALRQTDLDAASHPVLMGAATVFAEGLPLARVDDPVKPAGTQVYKGAATVLTEGQMTGRKLESVSAVAPFVTAAATVLIGGPGGGLGPLDPPQCTAPGANMPPSQITLPDGKIYDADKGTITDPATGQVRDVPEGVKFDPATNQFYQVEPIPSDEELAEMGYTREEIAKIKSQEDYFRRNWDFETGWSSTEFEQDQLWDAPAWLRDIFRADKGGTTTLGFPMKEGNWYVLGGLLDLGSPQWPGAGTGSPAWLVPDRIGLWKMNDYFVLHDWLFNPAKQSYPERLGVELQAFAAGLKPDLIQILLQIIYSTATTTVSITTLPDSPHR